MNKFKMFFVKIGRWFKNHAPSKRRLIQVYAALLYNANLKGFITGRIFKGDSKNACVPGLNCYSCPGAVSSCPLGAIQNALNASNETVPYYMLGILLLFGVIFGRTICGFLCPIGMLQELAYKIKTPKVKKNKVTWVMTFFKWAVLIVFVIAIPLGYGLLESYANPGFCKYFCPAGTLGGGFMLLLNPSNADMFAMLGPLFTWKSALLIFFFIASIFFYRFFCRFICPLGLIYGLFNKFSLMGVIVNKQKCTDCGLCVNACKMDIRKVGDMECINCGECISVCPEQAITWKGSKIFLHKDQLEPVNSNIKIDLISSLPKIDPQNQVETIKVEENKEEKVVEVKEPKKKKELYDKKKTKIFFISLFSALSVLLATALIYYNVVPDESDAPVVDIVEVGAKPKAFEVELLNSEEVYSFDPTVSNNKITVLNFWATWCGPCVAELPHFNEVYEKYSDKVEVIAIADSNETASKVESYINTNFSEMTITFAHDNPDNEVLKLMGGKDSLPYTVILDQNNVCQFIRNGKLSLEELEDVVTSLL